MCARRGAMLLIANRLLDASDPLINRVTGHSPAGKPHIMAVRQIRFSVRLLVGLAAGMISTEVLIATDIHRTYFSGRRCGRVCIGGIGSGSAVPAIASRIVIMGNSVTVRMQQPKRNPHVGPFAQTRRGVVTGRRPIVNRQALGVAGFDLSSFDDHITSPPGIVRDPPRLGGGIRWSTTSRQGDLANVCWICQNRCCS